MKVRIISYSEIEETIKEILTALRQRPVNEEFILEKGVHLVLILGLCIGQMKSVNSRFYPEKTAQLAILEKAKRAIRYKINTCTVEEISGQVTAVYRAFGVQ